MKKITKWFSVMLGCLTVGMMMTSCLGDGDSTNYEEEWKKYQETLRKEVAAMRGGYSGFVYHKALNEALDSTAVTWTVVSDTIVMLDNVPIGKVAGFVSMDSVTQHRVATANDVSMRLKIVSYVNATPLTFYVKPEPVKIDVVVDETTGEQETWTLNFDSSIDNQYSYGLFSMSSKQFGLRLYPHSLYAGTRLLTYFYNTPLTWQGVHQ